MGLKIAIVGCGAMGSALLKGWLTSPNSAEKYESFWVIAPHRENVEPFLHNHRVETFTSPHLLPGTPDIVVFAVKPSILDEILVEYEHLDSLMVSVASGKPLEFFNKAFLNSQSIVRAMPNQAVKIHQGTIALLKNNHLNEQQTTMVEDCFKDLGFTFWVKSDDEIDKITAISGSGPAYVYYFLEALAEGAETLGFKKQIAHDLAIHTFLGATHSAMTSAEKLSKLRQDVTSPKGTTAAAMEVLEKGRVKDYIVAAVKEAYFRAKELSL